MGSNPTLSVSHPTSRPRSETPLSISLAMKHHSPVCLVGGILTAALVLQAPAQAGTLSGTASDRERIALPPDAVFEVVIEDIARADAPATPLGRVRLEPAGQPPLRFSIPYSEGDLSPTGRQPSAQAALGRLPASWRGDLPAASGRSRWQVDLFSDGSFQLRQTFLDRPAPNSFDDIGRWRLEPQGPRLVLRGGREAPVLLQPIDGGAALRKLDLQGEPIRSSLNDRLMRLPAAEPIEPRLHLQGMFRYLADAASIRLCATGARLPVSMEADYLALERAYLGAQAAGSAGQPLLVNLEGLISQRPSAEPGQGLRRTLVVERFVGVHPGEGCPKTDGAAMPAAAPAPGPSLRGTLWRLQALQDGDGPELRLDADADRVSGSGGCNRLIGGFQLEGEQLRFSELASTKMACPAALMAMEQRYMEALGQVRRWSIDKRNLLLQDGQGRTLLLFKPAPPTP